MVDLPADNWWTELRVHHSDRGVQYASQDYTAELEQHRIAISMSWRGNVYDNAMAESFTKTLKFHAQCPEESSEER